MLEPLQQLWDAFVAFVEVYPFMLALGVMLLAPMGVPASPLLLLCGAVWGSFMHPVWVVACGVGSLFVGSLWPYALCRLLPDPWLSKIPFVDPVSLRERFFKDGENVWTFLFILRFTPGIPFSVHNVTCGVLKTPFRPYVIMSFLSCLVAGFAMIVLGDAVVSGNGSLVIGAIVLIVVVSLAVRKIIAKTDTSRGDAETRSL